MLKKFISCIQSYLKKYSVILGCCFLFLIILIAYLLPSFGEKLEMSTKWLSNITPIIVIITAYFLKEEIRNFHYKRRSEAASEIIGEFRVCAKELSYWVDAGCLTPSTGEESAEQRIHQNINKYIENCLKPSAQFPISIRQELDKHFEEMGRLANTISRAISINAASQPQQVYGKEASLRANEDLQLLGAISKIQGFLDTTLALYLNK